jgi:hypothetical protein
LAKKQKKNERKGKYMWGMEKKRKKKHVGNGKKMKKQKKNNESYNTFPTHFRV